MKVRYGHRAQAHLSSINAYLSSRNPTAARRVIARIRDTADNLASSPEMGRRGSVTGTREMVVRRLPYVIVYEVRRENNELVILAVLHGAQRR
jgi:toxin ParE1/3/4